MSTYQDRILKGETPTAQEWTAYLKEAHKRAPSMTPKAFDSGRTEAGLNSYEALAGELKRASRVERVLDLACGDGHLAKFIRQAAGDSVSIVGVDMSEGELAVARSQVEGVKFELSSADRLNEPSDSFDAVLCHMAFMLMTPLPPVAREILRVLKPGGVFAGVVGGSTMQGFALRYAQELGAFASAHFPAFKPQFNGDARTRTVDGLREILGEHGFTKVEARAFSLKIPVRPEEVERVFGTMYNVSVLPPDVHAGFMARLTELARAECSGSERLTIEIPMNVFSALKA